MAYVAPDGERSEPPVAGVMESGEDPKGWDRASIAYRSHPLHPLPNVSQADLLLPTAANKLRLVADCITLGGALALLCYFPLMLVGFTTTSDITAWILGTMLTVGLGSAIFIFVVALIDERDFRASLTET
jgi:hypothetical protein